MPAVGYALLTSCRSALSRSGCYFLPAVGPLFSPAGGACWCCCELLFVLDCPDLCPLPSVATCERRTHTTCAMERPWLRQGLGCPRADPRLHHRTFSHVLRDNFPSEAAHHTPSHRLRFASAQALCWRSMIPELGWPPCRRATCGPLSRVAGTASSLESLPRRSVPQTAFCTSRQALLCSASRAIVHSSALDRRVTASASRLQARRSTV